MSNSKFQKFFEFGLGFSGNVWQNRDIERERNGSHNLEVIVNGYVVYYSKQGADMRMEIHAETPYAAQQQAMELVKAKYPRRKTYGNDLNVVLAELGGEQVTHVATD